MLHALKKRMKESLYSNKLYLNKATNQEVPQNYLKLKIQTNHGWQVCELKVIRTYYYSS